MNDSPSDYTLVPFVPSNSTMEQLEKEFQVHKLLIRNEKYMSRLYEIRKKHQIGLNEIEGDNPKAVKLELSSIKNNDLFDKDIKDLANSIQISGDWFDAVRLHAIGFPPRRMSLFVQNQKNTCQETRKQP